MSYLCSSCNKLQRGNKVYPNKLCQSCYNYFRSGGKIHKLPLNGVIEKDNRGYVICHICGKSYRSLGHHVRESHNMTIAEYKEQFGLCNNCYTTENYYHIKMKEYAYKYDMPHQLIVSGVKTRVKDGDRHLRLGKKSRLQECLEKSKRCRNEI